MSRFLIVYKTLETLAVGLLLCPRRPPPLLRSTPLPLHRRRPLRSSCRLLPCDGAWRTQPRECGPGCSGSLTSRHPTPPHLPLPLLVFSVPTPLRRPAPGLRKIRPWCDSVWPSRSQIRGCHTTGAAASPPRLPAATSMRSVDSFSPGISALLLSSWLGIWCS